MVTKIDFILREHKIKQVEILEKSWQLAINQEKSKNKGVFDRGMLKQNINIIVNGKSNPTVKTLEKIAVCINSILKDRGIDKKYTAGDFIGIVDLYVMP